MDFWLSKLLGWLAMPGNLLPLVVLATSLPPVWRWRGAAALRAIAASFLFVCVVLPVGASALRPLEERYARPDPLPAEIAGVVVLGGVADSELSRVRGEVSMNERGERLHALVALGTAYPDAKLVFTGGAASLLDPTVPAEAEAVRRYAVEAGIDPARLVLESASRNTRENAVLTRDIVQPKPGETWLLVTSAAHMPRAMSIFRTIGWAMTPWPVDYQSGLPFAPSWSVSAGDRLNDVDFAAHEWLGLVYYRMRGWTDALVPGP